MPSRDGWADQVAAPGKVAMPESWREMYARGTIDTDG
jgi:hypothetical protein